MRKITSFISGLMIGSLVGATLALLLAPASGDDLRSEVQGRMQRLKDEMEQAASAKRAELEGQLSQLRSTGGGSTELEI